MKLPARAASPRAASPRIASPVRPSGTYLGCTACGRLLRIEWRTRSIVCACGARITPPPAGGK
jgi:hypothetical protein